MKRNLLLIGLFLLAGAVLIACQPAATPTEEPAPVVEEKTLLEDIEDKGVIRISTDPNYAPQSFLEPDGTFVGFDVDVANEIGDRLGPFDLTMIEVGAYNRAWPDWHIGPEQAVRAHRMVRGDVLLPVHWGMWNLALHGWTEPAERVLVAAKAADVRVTVPRPGESVEPGRLPALERWWPDLPWETAEEHPILSTRVP